MRKLPILFRWLSVLALLGLLVYGVWAKSNFFLPRTATTSESRKTGAETDSESTSIEIGEQARANLGLVSMPAVPQNYWRTIEIPGVIIDRPGVTDNGVTTPIEGVISQVHAIEGDVVKPEQKLFTIRLISEYLQEAQLDLFQAAKETEILNQEIQRLQGLVESGAVPGKRIIELQQNIRRQESLVAGQRQDLLSRGVGQDQINQIEGGKFLTNIEIFAPQPKASDTPSAHLEQVEGETAKPSFYEVQSLQANIGEQVKAGEVLAILANHSQLYVKGNAFKKEASNLARAAENGWPVEIDFAEDDVAAWPKFDQVFQIRNLANSTDPTSRTFDFYVSLKNQSRTYEKENRTFVVWRYRPGQRVRIQVPVEELADVLVLPRSAVVFVGPEAFVFQQNGDLFHRLAVRVLHQDRTKIVIANDGAIEPGFYLAQSSAAALNRVLKSKSSAGGSSETTHTHADGTTHGAH
jgi:multidrug efflux pump subunit AcrA (membrane-fusion protein)